MKQTTVKQWFSLLLITPLLILVACSNGGSETKTVGILQFADHQALNLVHDGFIDGLKAEGFEDGENIKVDLQLANNDQANSASIAQQFKVKMISILRSPLLLRKI